MDEDKDIGEARSSYQSGRVRIIGAEPAAGEAEPSGADSGAGAPADAGPGVFDFEAVEEETGAPEVGQPAAGASELPHWTEAPTGEVPAVLARSSDEDLDPWSSLPAPTWREEQSDWDADPGSYEPAMLGDEVKLGSLDDSGEAERQPWTFDLPTEHSQPPAGTEASEGGLKPFNDDTAVIPVVRPEPGAERADEDRGRAGSHARVSAEEEPVLVDDVDAGRGAVDADALWDAEELAPPPEPAPEPAPRRRSRQAGAPSDAPAPSRGVLRRSSGKAPPERTPSPRPPRRAPAPPSDAPDSARTGRDLPVAIAAGVALGIVALVFFKLGTVPALFITTVVVVIAVAEAYAAFRKSGFHPATLLGLVATAALMVAAYNKGVAAVPLVLVLVVAFTFLWYLVGVEPGADPVQGSAATLLVFSWVGVFGSFAALLLNPTSFPDRHGIAFLLGAVITSVACDVGALFVGARFGRRPLAPEISPQKTWEGAIGGAVASVLAAVIVVHFIHPWTLGTSLALGIVVAVVSPLGDLCESMIKRHLGLKDMGRILPGHGGLLDRVDGLLFVVPATYFLVKALNVG